MAGAAELFETFRGPSLVVEDVAHSQMLHRERATPGASFTLTYVHAPEQVPVSGTFRIEPDHTLTMTEAAVVGVGSGLGSRQPADARRAETGTIVARNLGARLSEVTLRVLPTTQHRLVTPSGRALDLSKLLGTGGSVRIRVK